MDYSISDTHRAEGLLKLRREYTRICSELLLMIHDNRARSLHANARTVGEGLGLTYQELSKKPMEVDLSLASEYVTLADRALVPLYDLSLLVMRSNSILSQLASFNSAEVNLVADRIKNATRADKLVSPELVIQAVVSGVETVHRLEEEENLQESLQLSRLRKVRRYVLLVLSILFLVSPILAYPNPAIDPGWDTLIPTSFHLSPFIARYVPILAIAVAGAMGGVLSGTITLRDRRMKLTTFRSEIVMISLKPIVGAFVALALYILLSWGVVPAITATSAGTYIALAMLAGLSERYFLRLLWGISESGEPRRDTSSNPNQP
jgi:hypothetical protein